jgi:hypothetical protein
MRLLAFGEGMALCVFIAVPQFCRLGEEMLFDVNWSFSSTTIVSPRSVSIVAHQSPELQHRFVRKVAGEDAPFTREIGALRTLPQGGLVQQPIVRTSDLCNLDPAFCTTVLDECGKVVPKSCPGV